MGIDVSSLIGRVIMVYKGGIWSQTGKLIETGEDYLLLQTSEQKLVYYRLEPIQEVAEDTKILADEQTYPALELDEERPVSFKGVLEQFIGGRVQVFGDPAAWEGRLLAVNEEFITLDVYGTILFYKLSQIISVAGKPTVEPFTAEPAFEDNISVAELLGALKRQWVYINDGEHQVQGVLSEITEDTAVIIHDSLVYYAAVHLIKTISLTGKEQKVQKLESPKQIFTEKVYEAPEESLAELGWEAAEEPLAEAGSQAEQPADPSAEEPEAQLEDQTEAQKADAKARQKERVRAFRKVWMENIAKEAAAQNNEPS